MSVEFTDEKFNNGDDSFATKTPAMVRLVMKTGLAKNEKQANIILFGISVVFLAVSFVLFWNTMSKPTQQTTYLEDIPADVRATIPPEILKTIPSRNN